MRSLVLAACVALAGCAGTAHEHSPYAGQQARGIKALSEQDVAGYESGAGMGFAKPAELNGYPGPMHVLELADRLALTNEQRAATHALLDRRWPVRAILRTTRSPKFAATLAPVCGMYAADQALHQLALLVSALLIAGL